MLRKITKVRGGSPTKVHANAGSKSQSSAKAKSKSKTEVEVKANSNSNSNSETKPTMALKVVVMRLYVVHSAPNSMQAIANLASICKEYLADSFKLEIVDVLKDPLRALADGILVTPSLAKVSPTPTAKIVGNLSDRHGVMRALGIQ